MTKAIQIIGGGVAGLALGLELRKRGVPVVLHEAGEYPRHKVCGEFISGRGRDVLERLGMSGVLRAQGARDAMQASFFTGARGGRSVALPFPALCVSRHALDAAMAEAFTKAGGELVTRSRAREYSGDGVVLASGRRRGVADSRWQWFGVKAHARNARLASPLEMHMTASGYVGLCDIGNGTVNVCGLFRQRVGELMAREREQLLRGRPGTVLARRMADAEFVPESISTVAALNLGNGLEKLQPGLRIGDALTMIPPVTGNGMSMALESAALAADPVAAYSRGNIDWADASKLANGAFREAFSARLNWAKWLHKMLFAPAIHWVTPLLCQSPTLVRMLFLRTRS